MGLRKVMMFCCGERPSAFLKPYQCPYATLDTLKQSSRISLCKWTMLPLHMMLSPFAKWFMWLWLWIFRIIGTPLLRLRCILPRKKLPPMSNNLLLHSATSLSHMIRTRQVTSEEVVQAYITRIRDVNPLLNCVVQERFRAALLEARTADQTVQVGNTGADHLATHLPLLGVPITIKESIAVQGLSQACGMRKRVDIRASEDAECLRLLREAGAIPILISNAPELCTNYETFNKVTGRTNNPYDPRRTVGGSSGGEAALLGAGASVIGLGSDVGGSSRIPALFTGVFGHKPTSGLVSYSGHIPTAPDKNWSKYFSISPMTRYAEDLSLMLKILAHENANKLRLDEKVNMRDVKVYYMEDDGGAITSNAVHPEIRSAIRRVVGHLHTTYNIKAQQVDLKDLKLSFDMVFTSVLRLEGVTSIFQKDSDPTKWNSVFWEFVKFFTCLSSSTFPPILYGLLKKIADRTPEQKIKENLQRLANLQKQFKDMLGSNGVFLYPTFIDPANFHYEMYFKFMSSMYSAIFNALELPATHCPMGLSRGGMPIGIQVISGPCQDRLSLAMACELEAAFGGWVQPPSTGAAPVPTSVAST